MARAKRTDRSEARRQHREQLRLEQETEETADEAPAATSTPAPQRRGLFSMFRLPNVREDARAFPSVVRHSHAIWLPTVIISGTFAVGLLPGATSADGSLLATIFRFAFQFVLLPPAFLAVFMAGFLAPRAQWLAGGLAGAIATVFYAALVMILGNASVDTLQQGITVTAVVLVAYLPIYFLMGGLGGWYRRWLRQTSERNRARAEEKRKVQARDARQKTRVAPSRR
ncbi:MAG: hypothetical protein A2X23_07635 [Chloroflexi bacterium GWC2_73_18]|nr:MAG: hypothetical protein A2X23_07635 [Chloroflexi bacterium GWC2_73_18]